MSDWRAVQAAVAGLERKGEGEWQRIRCPVCLYRTGKEDRRRSFDFHSYTGGFYCQKCQISGRVPGWAQDPGSFYDAGAPPKRAAVPLYKHETAEIPLPFGYYPLWEGEGAESEVGADARAYAATRVPQRLWKLLGVGATLEGSDQYANRIIIPIYDDVRRIIGWVGRSYLPKSKLPYLYPPKATTGFERKNVIYNEQALYVETDIPCLVVEGVFDTIYCWPHSVAVLGKPGDAQMAKMLKAKRPVVALLDGDAKGESRALHRRLRVRALAQKTHPNFRTGWIELPPKADPEVYPLEVLLQKAKDSLK